MEQTPPLNQVIGIWLADYSHFICDRLSLPRDQAGELLQEYLDLTARDPSQQPVASPYEQPTSYPEPPTPYHATHHREQPLNLDAPTRQQTLDPIHSQGPNPNHETYDKENPPQSSTSMALTVSNTIRQAPFPPGDPQSGGIVPINANISEPGAPLPPLLPQPIPPVNQTPIGSIWEYDSLWVQHNNEDPAAVERFSSAMKVDTLLSAGVMKIGDVLTFQVSVPGHSQPLQTEAHLSIISTSRIPGRAGKNFPDLSVTLLSNPNMQYPVAKACAGTTAMIEHLQTCNITVRSSNWRDIQVFRGQEALGSLWWVKTAFHLWRDRKDQEARETGQHFRNRRANKAGIKHLRHFKGVFGVWQHGEFVPDRDQARFRATG